MTACWLCCVVLSPLGASRGDKVIPDLIRDCSLHYVLPRTSLTPLLTRGVLSVHHVAYAYAVWKFAFHFLSRGTAELASITSELASTGKSGAGIQSIVSLLCFTINDALVGVDDLFVSTTVSNRPSSARVCKHTRSLRVQFSKPSFAIRRPFLSCTKISVPVIKLVQRCHPNLKPKCLHSSSVR